MIEIKLNSALDLINFFDLSKEPWTKETDFPSYAFRGQSDASWGLLPSAFRPPSVQRRNIEQIKLEFDIIDSFYQEASDQGIFHSLFRPVMWKDLLINFRLTDTMKSQEDSLWPGVDYYEIISIAQHYGLPTRFLDFSYNPLTAIYFATELQDLEFQSEDIAIFSINLKTDGFYRSRLQHLNTFKNIKRYQVVKAPSFFNENIKAQKGLFIGYFEERFKADEFFSPITLDDYIGDEITKATINRGYCEEILSLLSKKFIDERNLFPGINGVVKFVKKNISNE